MGTKIVRGLQEKTVFLKAHDDNQRWVYDCINKGDYISLIHWLEAIKKSEVNQEVSLIVQALIQLCDVCCSYQSELDAAWDQYQQAVEKEKALSDNLTELMTILMSSDSISGNKTGRGFIHQEERPLSTPSPAKLVQPRIWKRLADFFQHPQNDINVNNSQTAAADSSVVSEATVPPKNETEPAPAIKSRRLIFSSPESKDITFLEKTAGISKSESIPLITVYTLGPFRVCQDDIPILEWTNSKSAALFKFLLSRREEKIAKEILMDLFWPDTTPDAARNNLNVTIYNLRKTLRNGYHNFSHILFQDGYYFLNPEMVIWVDAEAFEQNILTAQEHERNGRFAQAVQNYHAAEALYQGEYLGEDRYEDWLIPLRQNLQELYLNTLDKLSSYYFIQGEMTLSMRLCRQILAVDACREEAHRQLMLGYYQLGQPYLALRQYHQCVENLHDELCIEPSQETTHLLYQIRNHEVIKIDQN